MWATCTWNLLFGQLCSEHTKHPINYLRVGEEFNILLIWFLVKITASASRNEPGLLPVVSDEPTYSSPLFTRNKYLKSSRQLEVHGAWKSTLPRLDLYLSQFIFEISFKKFIHNADWRVMTKACGEKNSNNGNPREDKIITSWGTHWEIAWEIKFTCIDRHS